MNQCHKKIISIGDPIFYFSDYPIHLSVLSANKNPICFHKNIIRKPITPLAYNFSMNFNRRLENHIIKDNIKIIYADCLADTPKNKTVISETQKIISHINNIEMLKNNINLKQEKISDLNHLKKFINQNRDADILIISAHGISESESYSFSQTGIEINNKVEYIGQNEMNFPPLVILNSCVTASKCEGQITIADMIYYNNAYAVIASNIEVNSTISNSNFAHQK